MRRTDVSGNLLRFWQFIVLPKGGIHIWGIEASCSHEGNALGPVFTVDFASENEWQLRHLHGIPGKVGASLAAVRVVVKGFCGCF